MKTGWRIDRDYLWKEGDGTTKREGRCSFGWEYLPEGLKKVRFRCSDDDGEKYYGGVLIDDDYGASQDRALAFCRNDAGCVKIEVKRAGSWIVEID